MTYDLVFEGGGAKGSVFVGALQVLLADHGFRRLVGTSAGAITATLLAAGYSPEEMLTAVNEKVGDKPRFATFMDIPAGFDAETVRNSLTYDIFRKVDLPWIPDMAEGEIDERIIKQLMKIDAYREIFSFVERGGLYAGDKFLTWIREKLDMKGGLGSMSFSEFHHHTGKDLSVVASDTRGCEMLVLNHRTAPELPVAWGVRMSMSIPFLWQEVRWQAGWGMYRNRDISGHTVVDGGVLSNFPIRLVSSAEPDVVAVMGDTDPAGAETLGLLIDESLEVAGAPPVVEEKGDGGLADGLLDNAKRLRTVERVKRLVDTMTDAHDRFAIDAHAAAVCRLPACGYGTTEFDMAPQRLDALVNAGRTAMTAWLAGNGGRS